MKNLKLFLCVSLPLMCGCGSTKTTVKSDVKVHQVTTNNTDSSGEKLSVTHNYGDTLKTQNEVPVSFTADSNAKPDTITITNESIGIKTITRFVPKYDKEGHLKALINLNTTIAKPVQTTDTRSVAQTHKTTQTVKDSTARVKTDTKTSKGWGLPGWVWWVAGIALLAVVAGIVFKFLPIKL